MMELLQKLNIEGDIMVRAGQGILKILLVMLAVKLSIRICGPFGQVLPKAG